VRAVATPVSHILRCLLFPHVPSLRDDGRLWQPHNREVGQKLGLATAFMFTLPLLAFFAAAHIFRDKPDPDMWAGGAAILVTNLIVGMYCYLAFIEDADEKPPEDDDNDASRPRVGIYKKRVE
jgi:hypothetical protein